MRNPEINHVRGRRLAELLEPWVRGRRPSSEGVRTGVRRLVLDGRLAPGTRLPAERELAEALGASRTLVVRAWELLRADGYVESRRSAGSWIVLPEAVAGTAGSGGWFPRESGSFDLAHATPPAPPEIADVVDRVRPRLVEQLHGHGNELRGLSALRERIAARFERRGLPTSPDQILVTNGAQHAFALVLRTLLAPGERVLVEHPTYPNAPEAIRGAHGVPVPVPMGEGGWDMDSVEATLRQTSPRLAYLMPDFQNPTGVRMDSAGRQRLAAALRKTRTTAVIDETFVDVDLSGQDPPPPMAAFTEQQVITIGSASKSFWGGLRIGWIRAPEELVGRAVFARAALDMGTPVLEQLVLAELLQDPEPALERLRAEWAHRRDGLIDALGANAPSWRWRVPEGGLSLWCDLGNPIGSRLAVSAEQHGVRIASGSRFAVQGSLERYVRLPYTLASGDLGEAVRRVALAAAALDQPAGHPEVPVT